MKSILVSSAISLMAASASSAVVNFDGKDYIDIRELDGSYFYYNPIAVGETSTQYIYIDYCVNKTYFSTPEYCRILPYGSSVHKDKTYAEMGYWSMTYDGASGVDLLRQTYFFSLTFAPETVFTEFFPDYGKFLYDFEVIMTWQDEFGGNESRNVLAGEGKSVPAPVPIPAGIFLLLTSLAALFGLGSRKRRLGTTAKAAC